MGFPDNFKLVGSKAKLYNRVGNSIVVPLVKAIAKEVKKQILEEEKSFNQKRTVYIEKSLFDYTDYSYNKIARYGT
jgi:DNA (cytosine-5)-methyltransferase 1